jgi:transketolase
MDTKELKKEAKRLILTASFQSQACHLGSSLSCSDIIVDLYFNRMKENDIFIFGKASGVAALYATLALKGVFSKEKVAYYLKRYPLASKQVKNVYCSTGSLGHGICIAVGTAMAKPDVNVFCLLGNGDLSEGTFFESILFAKQHRLQNLHIIIDDNSIVACGRAEDVLDTSHAVFLMARNIFPMEIVKTIKGDNISFLRDKIESHYMNLTEPLLIQALSEIK